MKSTKADVPIDDLLGRGSLDLDRTLGIESDFLMGEDDHEHDDGITSVSLTHPGHMNEDRFHDWIGGVLA